MSALVAGSDLNGIASVADNEIPSDVAERQLDPSTSVEVVNPHETGGTVRFSLFALADWQSRRSGEAIQLQSGEQQLFAAQQAEVIVFHRGRAPDGTSQGRQSYRLQPGNRYAFKITSNGWDLSRTERSDEVPTDPYEVPAGDTDAYASF